MVTGRSHPLESVTTSKCTYMVSTGASIPARMRSIKAYCSRHLGGSACGLALATFGNPFLDALAGVEDAVFDRFTETGDSGSFLTSFNGSSLTSGEGSRFTRFRGDGAVYAYAERFRFDEGPPSVRDVERVARLSEVNEPSRSGLTSDFGDAWVSAVDGAVRSALDTMASPCRVRLEILRVPNSVRCVVMRVMCFDWREG